jgi:DNA-binding CsgD family transcriptional regulator
VNGNELRACSTSGRSRSSGRPWPGPRSSAARRTSPPDAGWRWAGEELSRAEALSLPSHELDARTLLGLTELLDHDPARAASSLAAVWEHTEREGIEEPGVFPVGPQLVEARVELGEVEAARAVAARLRQLAEQQAHPWGLAAAKQCEALLELTARYDERAAQVLEQAAGEYDALGLRFDAARSLLLLGRLLRRHRKWGAARRVLGSAAAAFDALESPGWAEEARAQLARVGARRPAAEGALTPTERRVVELASDGLANKEIAQTLYVSVKTVEGHLSQAYAKLGIRSRAQLARRLADGA